jgi:hypothetical protein
MLELLVQNPPQSVGTVLSFKEVFLCNHSLFTYSRHKISLFYRNHSELNSDHILTVNFCKIRFTIILPIEP